MVARGVVFEETVWEPFLEERPVVGPKAVECGDPGTAGAVDRPPFLLEARAEGQAGVEEHETIGPLHVREEVGPLVVDEKVGPHHVKAEAMTEASAKVGPFPLPT